MDAERAEENKLAEDFLRSYSTKALKTSRRQFVHLTAPFERLD